jgi:hypothetical protein
MYSIRTAVSRHNFKTTPADKINTLKTRSLPLK